MAQTGDDILNSDKTLVKNTALEHAITQARKYASTLHMTQIESSQCSSLRLNTGKEQNGSTEEVSDHQMKVWLVWQLFSLKPKTIC